MLVWLAGSLYPEGESDLLCLHTAYLIRTCVIVPAWEAPVKVKFTLKYGSLALQPRACMNVSSFMINSKVVCLFTA